MDYIATTAFGLEATVKREVTRLGYNITSVADGRVDFEGDIEAIPAANIWLRSADRVLLRVGEFEAVTFDELFEKTKALPWQDWITEDGKFTVIGKSIKSTLFSVSDCQSIVKKAIVEKLKQTYNVEWFEETGSEYKVQVGLLKDKATLTIDTSGSGLHKRGYRKNAMEAPLKETLAATLIDLSYWRKDRIMFDPVCGSGTILIEAALIGRNIAPGISRHFVSEGWPQISKNIWREARAKAYSAIDQNAEITLYGSDMDANAIALAESNAELAGVGDCIHFETKLLKDAKLPGDYGVAIMNPPYGERLGRMREVEQLYSDMGRLFRANETWSVYVMTSDEDFEKCYGKPAEAKRKLYNGMIKTDYYQYYGKKPDRKKQE